MVDLANIVGAIAQSGIGSGFSQMGQDLGGARGLESATAYQKGASGGLDLVKKQLEARKLRDEAVARDATLQKMTAAFPDMDPGMVELMANTMTGGMGSDFNSSMSGAKTAQQMKLQREAAAATDPMIRNQVLAAMHGQPQDLTKVAGDVAYNPTVAPADQTMVQTPAHAAEEVRRTMVVPSQIERNEVAAINARDREARAIAKREAQRIADQARMDGMKISSAQERLVADAMLNGTDFSLRDESVPKGMSVSRTSTPGGDFSGRVQFKPASSTANTNAGPAAARPGMSTPVQTNGAVAAPKSKAEYDALPSGAMFLAPDGTTRVKP